MIILSFPIQIIIIIICAIDTGSPIFRQFRLGKSKSPFILLKFRTMHKNTHSVGTHMVDPKMISPIGRVLRKSKLDELPQLFNVLWGDMSLVGPRPCLANQKELIEAREAKRVFDVKPGITGLAQVKGIDMSTPDLLTKTDAEMLASLNVRNYFRYLWLTVVGHGLGDRIKF